MKGGTAPQLGFTVVEILIVLAVTAMIFFSASVLISGKVRQTEFVQAVNDFQTVVQQRINEVINGYYPNSGNFSCSATPSGPSFSSVAMGQGTNDQCIFIGKAIQMAVGSSTSPQYNVYTITGLRQDPINGNIATSLPTTLPMLVAQGVNVPESGFPANLPFESGQLENGLIVNGMWYDSQLASNKIVGMEVISGLGPTDQTTGALTSGVQQANLYVQKNSVASLGEAAKNFVDDLDNATGLRSSINTVIPKSVLICLDSGGSQPSALISIGPSSATDTNGQLSVTRQIFSNTANCT